MCVYDVGLLYVFGKFVCCNCLVVVMGSVVVLVLVVGFGVVMW